MISTYVLMVYRRSFCKVNLTKNYLSFLDYIALPSESHASLAAFSRMNDLSLQIQHKVARGRYQV
jgi:hypothetical protein